MLTELPLTAMAAYAHAQTNITNISKFSEPVYASAAVSYQWPSYKFDNDNILFSTLGHRPIIQNHKSDSQNAIKYKICQIYQIVNRLSQYKYYKYLTSWRKVLHI